MKKHLISFALIQLFWLSLSFSSNPQIRICNTNGAEFWSLKLQAGHSDEIGFCRYGEAYMGAQSLMSYFNDATKTLAVEKYFLTRTKIIVNCEAFEAQSLMAIDSNGFIMNLCSFSDGSFIGEETLLRGWYSDQNSALNENLLK